MMLCSLQMDQKSHRYYYSCLIRIWEARTNDEPAIRASLERPGLKERMGFSNIDDLFAFIREDVGRMKTETNNKSHNKPA